MTKTSFAAIAFALTSVLAGQAMAADQAATTTEQVAVAAKAADKAADTKAKASASDAFAEYDKIKKW